MSAPEDARQPEPEPQAPEAAVRFNGSEGFDKLHTIKILGLMAFADAATRSTGTSISTPLITRDMYLEALLDEVVTTLGCLRAIYI